MSHYYEPTDIRRVYICPACSTPVPGHWRTSHKLSKDCAPHADRIELLAKGWFAVNHYGPIIPHTSFDFKNTSNTGRYGSYRMYVGFIGLTSAEKTNAFVDHTRALTLPNGRLQHWVTPHFWRVYVDVVPYLAEKTLQAGPPNTFSSWEHQLPQSWLTVLEDFKPALLDEAYAEMLRLKSDMWFEARVK